MSEAEAKKTEKPSAMRSLWKNWIRPIGTVVLVVTMLRSAVADWNDVPTGSMLPTIAIGDRIAVNKLAYDLKVPFTDYRVARWSQPARGDVVTFWSPENGQRLVKRVVGLPGETLEMRRGVLTIDGEPVAYTDTPGGMGPNRETLGDDDHPVRFETRRPHMRDFGPLVIPPDHFFMLGDNRDASRDSRIFGPVHRDAISGEAFGVALSLDPENAYMPRWDRFFSALD